MSDQAGKCGYKMMLEVTDEYGGVMSFASERTFSDVIDDAVMADDAAKMLSMPDDGPCASYLISALAREMLGGPTAQVYTLLACLHRHWTGRHQLVDCLSLTVDVGKLTEGDDVGEEILKELAHSKGWARAKGQPCEEGGNG